jgi:outer membrane cobalamin receptor
MLGIGLQRRTPIVNDPRVRGSRVGQVAASGSHWVPARIDLNTAVSQIDSHLVGDVSVIKGPYSVLFGPGLHFINVDLIRSPRFENGPQSDASTYFNYKTNGQQIYGRQDAWGGNKDSGWRVGYGYANGNNYVSGNGTVIPSGYTSQDVDLAYGYDLTDDSFVEVNFLSLIQNSVQYPGQAFDIDVLHTNGLDVKYQIVDQPYFDRFTADAWYNTTSFNGDAQRPGKRQTFPFFDLIDYVGFTFVNSVSSGYTFATTWGDADEPQFTIGTDFRAINQQLNEFGSAIIGFNIFTDANSPIPASRSIDPGVFVQQVIPVGEFVSVTSGLRADIVNADVTANPATMTHLGNLPVSQQSSLAAILGSSDFNQTWGLFGGFLAGEMTLDENWTLVASAGSTQRPPSLTELYAAEPFMFLIQNGLNTVTGDPELLAERIAQTELSLKWEYDRWQGSLNGFHAWAFDYLTFENIGIVRGPPIGSIQQTNLKYVNTDLATFAGADAYMQYEWNDCITPFLSFTYVDARDRTRNGQFATKPVEPGVPSMRVYGLPRGFFSGVPGADQENLPGIYPFQSRIGMRLHAAQDRSSSQSKPLWEIELAARVVAPQNRVATSLDESTTAGFAVWELRGCWQPSKNMSVVGGIENFANRNYREHLDYRSPDGISMFQPGINGYFGAELRY